MKKLLVFKKTAIALGFTGVYLGACAFSFFDMGELKKFNCKTQSIKPNPKGLNPKDLDADYYKYDKGKKKVEVIWKKFGKDNIIGTYNTYEKNEKLYWGTKDKPIWGGRQFHNLLTISTMKLKRKIYDHKGRIMGEWDFICRRGW